MIATPPANERQRLKALHDLGILDTPQEETYNALTALAAEICEAPIALVTLIDENRQWFKACLGFDDAEETSRDDAFCAHAIQSTDILVVPDTLKDERFADNPFVVGAPSIRFYAGAPLVTENGESLGTLCVVDLKPRTLNEFQLRALRTLSRSAMAQMQLGRQLSEQKDTAATLHRLVEQQKKTESALLKSQESLRLVEERWLHALLSSDLGVWDWDVQTGHVYFSDRWATMLGYAPHEISPEYHEWKVRVHPEDFDLAHSRVQAHIDQRSATYLCEYRMLAKDGSYRWVMDRGQVISRDASGRALRMVGTHTDITERKTALLAAERMTTLLSDAQKIAKMGSWELDIMANRLNWSAETCRLFGIEPAAFDGSLEAFLEFVLPEDRHLLQADQAELFTLNSAIECEYRIRRADGAIRWMFERGKVVSDVFGRPARRLGMVMDITGRKRAELLQTCEARALEAISSAQPLTAVLDQIALGYEEIQPGAFVSIMLADADQTQLLLGSAPSLPANYVSALRAGLPIGPASVSCGTVAHRREPFYVADIATEPLWAKCAPLALAQGLRACWSTPVVDAKGDVLATFAVYLPESRTPTLKEQAIIARMVHIVGIAVEKDSKETRLRTSEERFRLLAGATNDAIWDWDPVTDILWWNEGFEKLFGYCRKTEDPSLKSWTDHIHPEDAQRAIDSFHTTVDGKTASNDFHAEYRFMHKNGQQIYVLDRGHVIRDAEGKAVRVIGGMTDLSERRRAEELLRDQATLLDKAQDAILVRDLEHHILYWNHSAERLYGWTAEECIGKPVRERLYRDLAPFFLATETTLTKGEWVGELEHYTKAGKKLTIQGRWTLVRDDLGHPKSILAINTDITQRKKLEQQVLRAQRMESIGTLAGGIAHDLNNVLTPILMSIELLKVDEQDERRLSILSTIESSAKLGANMVQQVLSFGQGIEGQRLEVRLSLLLQEMEKMIQETFPKNIHVHAPLTEDPWLVLGDPTQLHQVLLNLCINARDAMPDGGTLSLSTTNVTLDEHEAATNIEARPGPHVMLQVEDTGTGMSPEIIERIFEPFFTTKALGKGTGLGLSTTLAIVKAHRGFIRVESPVGHGTRFSIYLPAHLKESPAYEVPSHSDLPRGSGETILVVDDELSVRQITQQTLEAFGYRVLLACNGAEATFLYARQQKEVAAVLTDMRMPIMDGPATIQALLHIDPAVRIIAASGHNSNGLPEKAARAGVRHFLPKPYTTQTLLKALRQVLTEPAPAFQA